MLRRQPLASSYSCILYAVHENALLKRKKEQKRKKELQRKSPNYASFLRSPQKLEHGPAFSYMLPLVVYQEITCYEARKQKYSIVICFYFSPEVLPLILEGERRSTYTVERWHKVYQTNIKVTKLLNMTFNLIFHLVFINVFSTFISISLSYPPLFLWVTSLFSQSFTTFFFLSMCGPPNLVLFSSIVQLLKSCSYSST